MKNTIAMESRNHEILQQIRRDQEDRYVLQLARYGAQFPMQVPSELPLPPVPEDAACLIQDHLWDCANKSTAMYLATDASPGPEAYSTLPLSYHVWKRSKHPCLERNTFLTKVIKYGRPFQSHNTSYLLDCEVVAIPRTVRTHLDLCSRFDLLHKDICEKSGKPREWSPLHSGVYGCPHPSDYKLNPLFRALFILIRPQDKVPDNWLEMNCLERGQATSVEIVLTGVDEGILVPIDLAEVSDDYVQVQGDIQYTTTTLHDALCFVAKLQDRQHEAEHSQGLGSSVSDTFEDPLKYSKVSGKYLGYSGPRITPELLLEHRDASYIPPYFRRYMPAKTENKTT
ncbi:hypothetical protein BLS_008496 [Venturia inaequalis]|uniref:Uncharacterized protein n=1 Tax=Venturia inaequalis TaxID=5025 RepID=A0A8H3UNW4_VENIN|nr:hypothetical protein EG328_010900 [Venturia inaequalis]KAE9964281.1 hypothetical protein BLS_008496 [Venturia inaequalis]KAE9973565.1 hypothetical protein EG327_009033 [Venturia inaequalis]RDI76720.1 hypothetical protein Vi05172_g13279 [Venturia inaequalis]